MRVAEGTQAEDVGVALAPMLAEMVAFVVALAEMVPLVLTLVEMVAFAVVEGVSEPVEETTLVEDEAATSCAASASAIEESTVESTHEVEELP